MSRSSEKHARYNRSPAGRARRLRYAGGEKDRARKRAYNKSPKGREAKARYRRGVIEVRIAGMPSSTYHVRPEMKEELQERLATFRQEQREELRDARIG